MGGRCNSQEYYLGFARGESMTGDYSKPEGRKQKEFLT
jgi:hypothetical protein